MENHKRQPADARLGPLKWLPRLAMRHPPQDDTACPRRRAGRSAASFDDGAEEEECQDVNFPAPPVLGFSPCIEESCSLLVALGEIPRITSILKSIQESCRANICVDVHTYSRNQSIKGALYPAIAVHHDSAQPRRPSFRDQVMCYPPLAMH